MRPACDICQASVFIKLFFYFMVGVFACSTCDILLAPPSVLPLTHPFKVRTLLHQYSRDGNIQLLSDNIHGVQARVHGEAFRLLPPLPVDEADETGNTPLMSAPSAPPPPHALNHHLTRLACRYNHDNAASLLISSGARTDLRDVQVHPSLSSCTTTFSAKLKSCRARQLFTMPAPAAAPPALPCCWMREQRPT